MAILDPLVMPLARELLACYDQELLKVTTPPMHVGLRTGTVVDHLISLNDDECCEGLAWVRPENFYPSSGTFPAQDDAPLPKSTLAWAVVLELGAVRCAPTPDATSIPTDEDWDNNAQVIMDDAAAMRRAICCFVAKQPNRNRRVLPGMWQPLSVQGGCSGGVLPVTIMGPICDCKDIGPTSS